MDLSTFAHWNPDNLYKPGSITWIFDHRTDVLYQVEYPDYHDILVRMDSEDGVHSISEKLGLDEETREGVLKKGFLLGRIGKGNMIAFWNSQIDPDAFDSCIKVILKEFPRLNNPDTVIISNKSEGFDPFLLKDLDIDVDHHQDKTKSKERCPVSPTLDVKGKKLDIDTVFGKFHMAKGEELENLKSAFCQQSDGIKQKLQQSKACASYMTMVDSLVKRIDCKSHSNWNNLLSKGRMSYLNDLKSKFGGNWEDDIVGQNFRTQKEIDAAWDKLNRREHKLEFKNWLVKEMAISER